MSSNLVWFMLVDYSTGETYKGISANSVSLPHSFVINQFLDILHIKYEKLRDVPSSALLVYKNKVAFDNRNTDCGKDEPSKEDSPVDGLGETEEQALVVAVQDTDASDLGFTPVTDQLRRLGIKFSIRDIKYLLEYDTTRYFCLRSPCLTSDVAQAIVSYAKSIIQSTTKRGIALKYSYYLDGSEIAARGNTMKSLYYAFSETGTVLFAKVYNGNKADFDREIRVNNELDHKNLVKFITNFSIQNDSRHIIILPHFPRSVADWIEVGEIPLRAIKMIARNCFDVLCYLHSKGFCYGNLKPSNIMLQNTEPIQITLINFSSIVRIGTNVVAYTPCYCLNADDIISATEHLDWICLGSSLAEMGGFEINHNRIVDLVDEVSRSTKEEYLKNLILSCLQNPSPSKIESALNQSEVSLV